MPLSIDILLNCQVDSQKQFIILCGNITYVTVSNFLDDFFHPAREDVNCEVLILNKMSPDLEFEGLLKREKTRVQYFQVRPFVAACTSILRAASKKLCFCMSCVVCCCVPKGGGYNV